MRKLEYKEYGTDNYKEGLFHCWGYENSQNDEFSISIAIIEKPNGETVTVYPYDVKFIDSPISC